MTRATESGWRYSDTRVSFNANSMIKITPNYFIFGTGMIGLVG